MVMLVITDFTKKRKIVREILLWCMIQRNTDSLYIFHFTLSTWKSTQKNVAGKNQH